MQLLYFTYFRVRIRENGPYVTVKTERGKNGPHHRLLAWVRLYQHHSQFPAGGVFAFRFPFLNHGNRYAQLWRNSSVLVPSLRNCSNSVKRLGFASG